MQVFKLFFKIAKSKFPGGLVYVIVFLAICFPLAKATASESTFTETKLNIVVFDEDESEESRNLIADIEKKNTIKELKNDPELILDAMYYEQVDYALTIKKGYGEKLAQTDATAGSEALFETYHLHDSYATAMMEQYLSEYVRMVRSYVAGGNDIDGAIKKTEEKIGVETEVDYVTFDSGMIRDEGYREENSVPFRVLPYVLISVLINVLCPILLVMKKKDQRYRINCSSMKTSSFSGQLFAGSALLVAGIWVVLMIAVMVIYGGFFRGVNCWLAVANSFVFMLISAALALVVSSFGPAENVISMITQCIGLGMSFLCGVFVPQSMLGDGVLAAAKFLPAYWYERANDILAGIQEGTMGDVGMCFLIQGGFLVVLILVAGLLIRQRPASSGIRVRRARSAARS